MLVANRDDGLPHPGTFVIDQNRVIRAKLQFEGYRKRHTSADLIRELDRFRPKTEAAE